MTSFLTLILAIVAMAAFQSIRRARLWNWPLLVVLGIVGGCAAAGIWGEGDVQLVGLVAIGYAFLVQVSPLLGVYNQRLLIRRHYKLAARLAFIDMAILPTAHSRFMRILYRELAHQVRDPGAAPAIATRLKEAALTAKTVQANGNATLLSQAALIVSLPDPPPPLSPALFDYVAARPMFAGSILIERLCAAGRLDEAGSIIARLNQESRVGPLTEGLRNRARLAWLAALGMTEALKPLIAKRSSLRRLFTSTERAALLAADPDSDTPPTADFSHSAMLAELQGFAGGPTRPPVVVVAIAVILVAIHSISVLLDLTGTYDLVRLGAYMQALVLKGEYWRAFSSMFLHGGFIHLAFNVAMLLYLGLSLGRFLRQPAILLLYLLSGLVGSAAVGIFAEASLMVGASGAVFGLMGALLVGVRIRPDALPGNVAKRMESMLVVLLVANLGLGAWVEFIALSAHVGGALAGAAIGWVMLQGPTLTTSVPRSIGPIGLVVTVTLYIGFSAWSVMGVSRAMALPISELIPLVTRTYTIAEVGLGRANIELQVPSTWLRLSDLVTGPDAEEARKQEAKDGPVLLDGSGGLQRTDVACRLRPEGFDLAAPRSGDAVALAAQLREHNSGDFEPGPAGFAVLQRTRGDETLIFAVGLFPKGRLDLKFAFVLKPTDARELVDSLLPHAKLTACIRTRTEPSDRTTD